jgi:hypothetical protein
MDEAPVLVGSHIRGRIVLHGLEFLLPFAWQCCVLVDSKRGNDLVKGSGK